MMGLAMTGILLLSGFKLVEKRLTLPEIAEGETGTAPYVDIRYPQFEGEALPDFLVGLNEGLRSDADSVCNDFLRRYDAPRSGALLKGTWELSLESANIVAFRRDYAYTHEGSTDYFVVETVHVLMASGQRVRVADCLTLKDAAAWQAYLDSEGYNVDRSAAFPTKMLVEDGGLTLWFEGLDEEQFFYWEDLDHHFDIRHLR